MALSTQLLQQIAINPTFQNRVKALVFVTARYWLGVTPVNAPNNSLAKAVMTGTPIPWESWAFGVLTDTSITNGTFSAQDGGDIPDATIASIIAALFPLFATGLAS